MNYEEQIKELNERIAKLEKAENKRIIKKRISMIISAIKYLIIIALIALVYVKVVKPYKEKIDFVEDKVESVEKFVNEKIQSIQKLNPFSKNN